MPKYVLRSPVQRPWIFFDPPLLWPGPEPCAAVNFLAGRGGPQQEIDVCVFFLLLGVRGKRKGNPKKV